MTIQTNIRICLITVVLLAGCEDETYQTEADQSYYRPGIGTVNVHEGQPPKPAYMAYGRLSEDIIVLSDLGFSVDYINKDGSTKWRHRTPGRGRGLHKWDDQTISYVYQSNVYLLDIETGQVVNQIHIGQSLTDFQKVDTGYLAVGSKVWLLDQDLNIIWTNPHPVKYPRSAVKVGDQVIIADTFNHRVYGVNITTDKMAFIEDEYFPNYLEVLSDGLLVVGEHSNRVYKLDISTGIRAEIYTCQSSPFDDIYSLSDEIRALENTGILTVNGRSVCAGDLYSPNGAAGERFIANTDEGAVLEIFNGFIVAEIRGFNNPVNIIRVNI